jgi:hypothetical protein
MKSRKRIIHLHLDDLDHLHLDRLDGGPVQWSPTRPEPLA